MRVCGAPEVAHHPSPGLGNELTAFPGRYFGPHAPQRIAFAHKPLELLDRARPDRVLKHRQAELQTRGESSHGAHRAIAEVVADHRAEVGNTNTSLAKRFTIALDL